MIHHHPSSSTLSKTGCGGCAGRAVSTGFFFAREPRDLLYLAATRATIHEIEVGFEPSEIERHVIERRLLTLHTECGCSAAAVVFLAFVVGVGVLRHCTSLDVSTGATLLASAGVALLAKVLVVVITRLQIVLIALRIAQRREVITN